MSLQERLSHESPSPIFGSGYLLMCAPSGASLQAWRNKGIFAGRPFLHPHAMAYLLHLQITVSYIRLEWVYPWSVPDV